MVEVRRWGSSSGGSTSPPVNWAGDTGAGGSEVHLIVELFLSVGSCYAPFSLTTYLHGPQTRTKPGKVARINRRPQACEGTVDLAAGRTWRIRMCRTSTARMRYPCTYHSYVQAIALYPAATSCASLTGPVWLRVVQVAQNF